MTQKDQSAHSRRLLKIITDLSVSINNNVANSVSGLAQSVASSINTINNAIQNLVVKTDATQGTVAYHEGIDNTDGWEARIRDLEAGGGGGGGGGGIDPTDPSVRIVYEDFLHLPSGNNNGDLMPYSTGISGGFMTAGLVFNPDEGTQFEAAPNETGHPGVLRIAYKDGSGSPVTSTDWAVSCFGVRGDSGVLKWEDVSRITIILKTPYFVIGGLDVGEIEGFMFGLNADFGNPEASHGIYFKSDLTNWFAVTDNGTLASTSIGTYTSDTWVRLDLKRNSSDEVEFYIDDVLVHTATSGIPTGSLNLGIALNTTYAWADGTRPTNLVDFVGVKLGEPEDGGSLASGATVEGTSGEVEVTYDSGTDTYTVGLPTSLTDDLILEGDPRLSDARTPTSHDHDLLYSALGHTHLLSEVVDYHDRIADPTSEVVLKDDFFANTLTTGILGDLGWRFTNGTVADAAAEANHPGIVRRTSTSTSGNVASMYLGPAVGSTLLRWDQFGQCTFVFRIDSLGTNATYRFGINTGAGTNPPAIGVYFEVVVASSVGDWIAKIKNGSSSNSSVNSWAASTGWVRVKIRRISNSQVGFTFDSNAEVVETLSTPDNIPDSTGMQWFVQIIPNAGTARSVDMDYFSSVIIGQTR